MIMTHSSGFNRQVACSLNGEQDGTLDYFDITITGIAAATATTTLIPDAQIPSNKKVYLDGYAITSTGSAWTTGTNIIIQDSSAVAGVTVLTANLPTSTTWADRGPGSVTRTEAIAMANGFTAGKGLQLAQTGAYAGAATLTVRVWGKLKTTDTVTY